MWFPSPGGPQSRVKDKAIKKVHMETPNVGRIITVQREEQVQFWGLRGHICGGVCESCLGNGDSSKKVQKGRNKQPVAPPLPREAMLGRQTPWSQAKAGLQAKAAGAGDGGWGRKRRKQGEEVERRSSKVGRL